MLPNHTVDAGLGAAMAKDAVNACALNRGKGYDKTMGAMGSRTRSLTPGTSKHNAWEGVGENDVDKLCGYGPGNGGQSMPGGYSKHY